MICSYYVWSTFRIQYDEVMSLMTLIESINIYVCYKATT